VAGADAACGCAPICRKNADKARGAVTGAGAGMRVVVCALQCVFVATL
jgi:hypothetical protein